MDVPAELADAERVEHEHLVEDVIELDDDLLEEYLSGTEPSPEQLEHLLHDAVDRALVFPVLCGSATTPIGADQLADFICRVGPAPGDRGPTAAEAAGGTVEIATDPDWPPLAVVFKTTIDEFLGQISMLKVLSGTIRVDDTLVNTRSGAKERLHHLSRSSVDPRPTSTPSSPATSWPSPSSPTPAPVTPSPPTAPR